MTGDVAVVWTARASLALLTAGFAGRHLGYQRAARVAWAAGAATMWAHLAAAFAVAHDWSHADAVRETARQTRDLFGIDWGGGVWINYLFAVVWTADAAWRCVRSPVPPSPAAALRRRRIGVAVGAFLGFIAANAAIVFEDGPTRWIGVGCCGLIAATALAGEGAAR